MERVIWNLRCLNLRERERGGGLKILNVSQHRRENNKIYFKSNNKIITSGLATSALMGKIWRFV
jgi:hypothetical protein